MGYGSNYDSLSKHVELDQIQLAQPRSSAFAYSLSALTMTIAYAFTPSWRASRMSSTAEDFEYWILESLFYGPVFVGNPPKHVVDREPLTYRGWDQCSSESQQRCTYALVSQICAALAILLCLIAVFKARASSRHNCLVGTVISCWAALVSTVPLALYFLSEEYTQLQDTNQVLQGISEAAIGHLLPEVFQGNPGSAEYYPIFVGQALVGFAALCNVIATTLFALEFFHVDEVEFDEADIVAQERISRQNAALVPGNRYTESQFM